MTKKKTSSKKSGKSQLVKRQGGGMRMVSGARPLQQSMSLPRVALSISSRGSDVIVVTGVEVVNTLSTSQNYASFGMDLDPGNSNLFPRLSGLARVFEKYRFRQVRVTYHPACPATRSGNCGVAVLLDPRADLPASVPELAGFRCSAVGSIAQSLDSGPCPFKDPQWFVSYTENVSPLSGEEDPVARLQGRIAVLVGDSASADAGLTAGFIALHYSVEFTGLRPTPHTGLLAQMSGAGKGIPGTADQTWCDWFLDNAAGWYNWGERAVQVWEEGGTPALSAANMFLRRYANRNQQCLPEGGAFLALEAGMGAASARPGLQVAAPTPISEINFQNVAFTPPAKVRRLTAPKTSTTDGISRVLRASGIDNIVEIVGQQGDDYFFRVTDPHATAEEVVAALRAISYHLRGGQQTVGAPLAAGDVTWEIYAQYETGDESSASLLFTSTRNSTSATTYRSSAKIVATTPLRIAHKLYAVDSRQLDEPVLLSVTNTDQIEDN